MTRARRSPPIRFGLLGREPEPRVLSMMFPGHRPRLGLASTVALVAREGGRPVGLAVAELEASRAAEVLSIFVVPERRGQGLGARLLARLEGELVRRRVLTLNAVWLESLAAAAQVGALLRGAGWSEPGRRLLLVDLDVERLGSLPWARLRNRDVVAWHAFGREERARLRASNARRAWIPAALDPFACEGRGIDPLTSVGLRHGGEIAGWVLTQRTGPGSIVYPVGFVREDLRGRGLLFAMGAESTRRQRRAGITRASLTIAAGNERMLAILGSHPGEHVTRARWSLGAAKSPDRPLRGAC